MCIARHLNGLMWHCKSMSTISDRVFGLSGCVLLPTSIWAIFSSTIYQHPLCSVFSEPPAGKVTTDTQRPILTKRCCLGGIALHSFTLRVSCSV